LKAQSAIEFITSYSWAIILLLLAVFVVFYYLSAQQPTPKCDFGIDLPCPSFKLFQNTTGDIRFVFQLNNGMGKAIAFTGAQITVNNIGNNGVNNYTGTCWGNSGIIKGGDPVYCAFDITDTAVIPPANRVQSLDVALSYVDCETSPRYPTNCLGGLNRTVHGTVTATFEVRPTGVVYCPDGVCNAGETYLNCPIDCPATCGLDCSFGHTGICNASCSTCSGGTGGTLAYSASCCGGTPTSCGTSSCPVAYCLGAQLCTYQSSCNNTCSGGSCQSCNCIASCTPCPHACCLGGYCDILVGHQWSC
jgi:hypothetical protein